jgi:hypothetical protein
MDAYQPCDVYAPWDIEELEKRAVKMAAFSLSAATAGNTVVVFTMLLLQEILEELAQNPIVNLSSITQVSNSIGILNTSIKIVP